MPSSACFLQYKAVLLPTTLNFGIAVQESCKQRLPQTFTIPSSACSLQYTAVLLPTMLKFGTFVHESYEQRLLDTSTMPSSAYRLQYTLLLLPSTLKLATVEHKANAQRLWTMFAMLLAVRGFCGAKLGENVNHAVSGMLFAVNCLLVALKFARRARRARFTRATQAIGVHHLAVSVLLAVLWGFGYIDIEPPLFVARIV